MAFLRRILDAHAASKLSRRAFIGTSLLTGLIAACSRAGGPSTSSGSIDPDEIMSDLDDNIYTRLLGVQPHLPTHDHITRYGGSRMPIEVMDAMREANEYFVDMDELTIAAGKRVAEIVHADAALITCGAFSGLVLGAAACLTGDDQEKMKALPHPTWEKRECLTHKAHTFFYDRAYRSAGMDLVVVDTTEEMANAISQKTAMLACLASVDHDFPNDATVMKPLEFVELGRKAGVPVLIDAASEIPPIDNLTRYTEMGGDLVVISGGKGLRGPQSAGILAGRADLIEAARLQAAPNGHLGRGMKVGKEEIVGFIAALNRYVELDHQEIFDGWMSKAEYIAGQLKDVPGLDAQPGTNPRGVAHVALNWDETVIPLSREQMRAQIRSGTPRLAMTTLWEGNKVGTRCMRDGEEILVARRLKAFFLEAGKGNV
jgi:seryl-tRNA(Sec) selenium transferase